MIPPADDWRAYVDDWKARRNRPESLYTYMLYVQTYYRTITEYPTLNDYKIPNEYVREIVSPGDSYTAGIGSNGKDDHIADSGHFSDKKCGRYKKAWAEQLRDHSGWADLQKEGYRQNNFGACSGHIISQIQENQLALGEPRDGQIKAIGKPQLAVLTAGGNDFQFADVIMRCILRLFGYGNANCEGILKQIEDKLSRRDEAIRMYQDLFSHLMVGGRLSKGAMVLDSGMGALNLREQRAPANIPSAPSVPVVKHQPQNATDASFYNIGMWRLLTDGPNAPKTTVTNLPNGQIRLELTISPNGPSKRPLTAVVDLAAFQKVRVEQVLFRIKNQDGTYTWVDVQDIVDPAVKGLSSPFKEMMAAAPDRKICAKNILVLVLRVLVENVARPEMAALAWG